jgi:hypothetical protein
MKNIGAKYMAFGGYIKDSYTLPREEARQLAKRFFERYPKQGYDTHISYWKVTEDNQIYFEICRLASCD